MLTLLIAIGSFVGYLVAYHTYGRWLARKIFNLDAEADVPSQQLRDDIDYVPTRKEVIFGHHFTSIAGTGPIVGPAIAVFWGWLPALLWVLFGSIFIGAVHDFGALVISLRNRGQTVGEVAGRLISPRARILFLLVLFLALTVVLAVFGLVIASIFAIYPESVLPTWASLPLAVAIGVWVYRRGGGLLLPSLVALGIIYGCVWLGAYYLPIDMQQIFGHPHDRPVSQCGCAVDVRAARVLLHRFGSAGLGAAAAPRLHQQPPARCGPGPARCRPDRRRSHRQGESRNEYPRGCDNDSGRRPTDPSLPVHHHRLRSLQRFPLSGLQRHDQQADRLRDRRPVRGIRLDAAGRGPGGDGDSRLLCRRRHGTVRSRRIFPRTGYAYTPTIDAETGQPVAGLAAWSARYNPASATGWRDFKLRQMVGAFVDGGANFLSTIGIPIKLGVGLIAVLVACFAATTLDSATRLNRYVVQELASTLHLKPLTNKYAATGLAVVLAGALAMMPANPTLGPGSGGLILWPLFGATNQLLAGLALMVTVFYLWRRSKPILFALVPMLLMLAMPLAAMLYQMFAPGSGWLARGDYLLFSFGVAICGLQVWMVIEGLILWPRVRGVVEEGLPPLPQVATATSGPNC